MSGFRDFFSRLGEFLTPGDLPPNSIRAEVDVDAVQRLTHTERFQLNGFLVVRRGESFPIRLIARSRLTVSSATLVYEEGKHEVALELGELNSKKYGTTLEIRVPADTPVTMYLLKVKGNFENGVAFDVDLQDRVVVLFNPWSESDGVFLAEEDKRQEYVLNSGGRVYIGDRYGTAWNLALYKHSTFQAVLYILETLSKLSFEQKRDPVLVAREMSAMVNVQDDNGVLMGRWDGKYDDGKDPSFWTGSGAILKQFYENGGEPVRYGQCWVFSAVLLTVLRVLGIPSRSVTNFNSAHDTNRNRTIDEYYDEEGTKIDYLKAGSDSIWNFHVWNETWMRRSDLPAGFNGWQALDATPQEESPQGGGYKTGPSPLKAIKEGNSLRYDTNFIIAEVNADIKKYVVEKGVPRLFDVDTRTVGKTISTKQVGSWRREDITNQYKYPEGSGMERRALYHGYKELMEEVHDVTFSIPEAEYEFGQDVTLTVKATNKANQHSIRGTIQCQAVTYTGKFLEDVDTKTVRVKVNKGKSENIAMTVDGAIFSKYSRTKVYLKFTVGLAVVGTSQMFSETVSVAPSPPKLTIEGPDKIAVGKTAKLLITFKNPLPIQMEDVTLNIDVDDMIEDDLVQKIGTIEGNAEFKYVLDVTATKLGQYTVVVGLASDKVEHVTGEKEVEVLKVLPPTPPIPFDTLEIETVELNYETNRKAHLTDAYDYEGLVVRRGQSFTIDITTSKPFPKDAKVVTRAIFQLISKNVFNRTSFEVKALSNTSGNAVSLELQLPADVSVGEYDLLLTVDDAGMVSVLDKNIKLVILFNPWCKDDSCHHHTTSDLEEYVLNSKGRIWVGSASRNYGRPWQFAQFAKDSLEVALWVLDHIRGSNRGDPVEVARKVSAMTNIQDDNGILVGNWSGDYSGGTSPSAWTGSLDILKEFNATKDPVQFGQCWVFSGLQTTLLRCIGLPARSITNFNSAHDTNFNRAVDKFVDTSGESIDADDSIWNFHVWNEAWMARPDLPDGFGGWQALDATPQEESPQGGGYRLGPSPVRAIKLGQRMNYDVEFVISEVNADIRYYTVHEDGTQTLSRVNTSHVGKNMSTKAVGSANRQDVTLEYKFQEGSSSERVALLAKTESEKVIGVELKVADDKDVTIGQDFVVKATVTNKSSKARTLKMRLYGRAMMYTNAPGQLVKETNATEKYKAGESKTFEMFVSDWDYLRILHEGNFINFVCMVLDEEKKMSVLATEDFRLRTPDIDITLPEGGLKLYQPVQVSVSFTNPLDQTLTGGKCVLKGDGFVQDATVDIPRVYAGNTVQATFKTVPVKRGSFELLVRFSSSQLTDVMGVEDVVIS